MGQVFDSILIQGSYVLGLLAMVFVYGSIGTLVVHRWFDVPMERNNFGVWEDQYKLRHVVLGMCWPVVLMYKMTKHVWDVLKKISARGW